jgi:uncharacterized protein
LPSGRFPRHPCGGRRNGPVASVAWLSALSPLLAVLALLVLAGAARADLRVPPPPDRRVSDYAGVLAPAERERLEQQLAGRERSSSNQVVVAIFRSLEGESLEDFSIRLAQAWRVGQKGLDNGVIFLVFVDDRKMRIEVGYGLEPTLTDAIASSILRDVVAPRFRQGRLADGIGAGLDAIEQAIAGTYRAPAPRTGGARGIDPLTLVMLLVVLGGLGLAVVPPLLFQARSRRHGWTGLGSGWGGPYVGGGWRGGSSGWGGGGGWSGGGGGFGGGGASGSW